MIKLFFGHHQFIYSRRDIEISLVELRRSITKNSGWAWECYCLKGNAFEGTKTFDHKQDAEDYIIALLTPENQL